MSVLKWLANNKELFKEILQKDKIVIASALIGCGLGGLKKEKVISIIKRHFNIMNDVTFIICAL